MKGIILRAGMILLAALGVFIAGTLSLTEYLGTQAPCGESGGCALVTSSVYSRFLGIPVAYVGLAAYLVFLGIPLLGRQAAIRLGFALAALGTGISGLLLALSYSQLHEVCRWCMGSGATMAALFLCYFFFTRNAASKAPWWLWPIAAVSVLFSAGASWIVATHSPANLADLRKVQAAPYGQLIPSDAPSKGPTSAPVVLVEFADFACPACRDIYGRLHQLSGHVDGLRIVFRHLPHPYLPGHQASQDGAIAAEVATSHGKFWEFADKAFALGKPTKQAYYDLLKQLGLPEKPDKEAESRVARDIAFAESLGIHVTPVFVVLVPGQPRTVTTNVDLPRRLSDPDVLKYLRERP